ncbi:MAG: DUF190 domain-containing protein [Chromatiales bacterium]|nr:DUF190 domain-containing protein [Chromatiales bacterium]
MTSAPVTMVRIYLTEGEHQYQKVMDYLHDEAKVAGVTAFRGIAGYGGSGEVHGHSLLDISLDLPLIIEFFDQAECVGPVVEALNEFIKPGHIVTWPAAINIGE